MVEQGKTPDHGQNSAVREFVVYDSHDLSPAMVAETLRIYQQNISQYAAEVYEPAFRESAKRQVIDLFLSYFPDSLSHRKVLVAGVGPGGDAGELLQRNIDVYGIDIVPEMITYATQHLQSIWLQLRAELDKTNSEDLPHFHVQNVAIQEVLRHFSPEMFDGVLCNSALPNLPLADVRDFLFHIFTLMKEEGIIQVAFKLSKEDRIEVVYIPYGNGRRFSLAIPENLMIELCSEAHFTILDKVQQPHIVDGEHRREWLVIICQKPHQN